MTNDEIGAAGQGAAVALHIDGEMTIYRAAELKAVLSEALERTGTGTGTGTDALVLDLSQVTEFDSAGAQLLLSARREALRQGRALRLAACSPAVREVFDLVGLWPRFEGGRA